MKHLSSIFVLALALGAAIGLSGCASTPNTGEPGKPLRVLFIGNSYTYVNMLPDMLQQFTIAKKEHRPLEYKMLAPSGASLQDHWANGKSPAIAAIAAGGWDYVVLQDQSLRPVTNSTNAHLYARLFDKQIEKVGAQPVFYLTWARKNAPEQQAKLNDSYATIANELNARLCPVGPAWAKVLKDHPEMALHSNDGSHPTGAGTYLAACVFYSVLYDKSPVGLPATIVTKNAKGVETTLVALSDKQAKLLQQTAFQTVKEWNRGQPPFASQ